jgi:hypothetical protein
MTRGPAEFEVAAVGRGGRGAGPGAAGVVAAVAVVLVILGGLVSSALFPAAGRSASASPDPAADPTTRPTANMTAIAEAAESTAPSGAQASSPFWTPRVVPTPTTASALVAGVRDGSLDGGLVFVSGRIHGRVRACPTTAASDCALLTLDGLRVRVVVDGARGGWAGDPAAGTAVVLRVAERTLFYVGSVVVAAEGVPGTAYLSGALPRPGSRLAPPTSLVEADGMLLRNDDTTCLGSVTSCGRHAPYIVPTRLEPSGRNAIGAPIGLVIAPVAVGLDVTNSWVTGPFLVRDAAPAECPASGFCPVGPVWEVVARETPGGVVGVRLP